MKQFSLAGLLRVRHAQQQKAMAELSDANRQVRDVAERRARAERVLEQSAGDKAVVTDAGTLMAVAAARASTRGMLAELDAMADAHRVAAAEAQADFNAARARSIALEKLEARHREAAIAEDLRDEQLALDEIAGARTRLDPHAATPSAATPSAASPAATAPHQGDNA